MKPNSAKVGLRIVGATIGLFGMLMVCMMMVLLYRSLGEPAGIWMVFSAFAFVVGVYLVHVGFIGVFRFSPRAVRHICGTVVFIVLTLVAPTGESNAAWGGVIFFGCLIAAYFGYRAMSDRLNRWIFPSGLDPRRGAGGYVHRDTSTEVSGDSCDGGWFDWGGGCDGGGEDGGGGD